MREDSTTSICIDKVVHFLGENKKFLSSDSIVLGKVKARGLETNKKLPAVTPHLHGDVSGLEASRKLPAVTPTW